MKADCVGEPRPISGRVEGVCVLINGAILERRGRQGGLVAALLLLLQDLKLQELLLLLQETGIRRVHQHVVELLLLVWGDVLVIF